MPLNVAPLAGVDLGEKLAGALASPGAYRVFDCRDLTGSQSIHVDVFAGLTVWPISVLFGPSVITVTAPQTVPSNTSIHLDQTVFRRSFDEFLLNGKVTSGKAQVTAGSDAMNVTGAVVNDLRIGGAITVFGYPPRRGSDRTALTQSMSSAADTAYVSSTAGFPSTGFLRIENELMHYQAILSSPPRFDIDQRGFGGTSPTAHTFGSQVDRPVYERFIIKDITSNPPGSTVTVDSPLEVSGTTIPVSVGATDVHIMGKGVFDGLNLGVADSGAIFAKIVRHWSIGPACRFVNFASRAIQLEVAIDCTIDGYYEIAGHAAVFLTRNCVRNKVFGCYVNVQRAVMTNDRGPADAPDDWDNESAFNLIRPYMIDNVLNAVLLEGSNDSFVQLGLSRNLKSGGLLVNTNSTGWVNNPPITRNMVDTGHNVKSAATGAYLLGLSGYLADGDNRFIVRSTGQVGQFGAGNPLAGNHLEIPAAVWQLIPGATVQTDVFYGDYFKLDLPSGLSSCVMAQPTHASEARSIMYEIRNGNPTVAATVTWNSVFKLHSSFASIAPLAVVSISFYFDGQYWQEVGRAA